MITLSTENVSAILPLLLKNAGLEALATLRKDFRLPDDWDGEVSVVVSDGTLSIAVQLLPAARMQEREERQATSQQQSVADNQTNQGPRSRCEKDIVAVLRQLGSCRDNKHVADDIISELKSHRHDHGDKTVHVALATLRKRSVLVNDDDKLGYYLAIRWQGDIAGQGSDAAQ